jgi:hypothetical protein
MVVNLVEMTSVDELVDKVKKGKYRNSSEILAKKSRNSNLLLELYYELIFCRRGGSCIRR